MVSSKKTSRKGKGGSGELLVPAILLAAQGAYRKVLEAEKKGGAKKRGRKHGGGDNDELCTKERRFKELLDIEAQHKAMLESQSGVAQEEVQAANGDEMEMEQGYGNGDAETGMEQGYNADNAEEDARNTVGSPVGPAPAVGGKKKGKKRGGNAVLSQFEDLGNNLDTTLRDMFLSQEGGKHKGRKRHGGDAASAHIEKAAKVRKSKKHGGADEAGAALPGYEATLATFPTQGDATADVASPVMEGGKGKAKKTRKAKKRGGADEAGEALPGATQPEGFSEYPGGSMEGGKGKTKKTRKTKKHGGAGEEVDGGEGAGFEMGAQTGASLAEAFQMDGGKKKRGSRKLGEAARMELYNKQLKSLQKQLGGLMKA